MIHLKPIDKLKIATFAVKTFFLSWFFFAFGAFAFMNFYSYETFTQQLIEQYGKQDKLEMFRLVYLTEQRFSVLRIITVLQLVLLIVSLIRFTSITKAFAIKILSFGQSIQAFKIYLFEYYSKLHLSEKLILFFVIVLIGAVKWFFLSRYFFHIDEIFSYLFFVKKGFLVLISYYPGPNNHVFYSLLVYLWQPFISHPFYLMKVPSFLVSILSSLFFFLLVRRYYDFSISIVGTVLFSFSIHFFFYSIFGRGYVLMTFFTMISAFLVLEILEGKNEKFLWHMYVLASVLGFYSMLIYLYPFVTFVLLMGSVLLFHKRKIQIRSFLYYNTVVVVGTLFLYAPIILVSGFGAMVSNSWVVRLEWAEFFSVFPKIINSMFVYILNVEEGAIWIGMFVLTTTFWILMTQKKWHLALLILSMFVTPLLLLMIQRVNPFDRVWTYLILSFCWCLITIMDFCFSLMVGWKYTKIFVATFFSIGIIFYSTFYFYENTRFGHQIYDEVGRISHYVAQERNSKVYTNEDVYNMYLRYEYSQIGREDIPGTPSSEVGKEYNYILLVPKTNFPEGVNKEKFRLREKNEYIEVYQLKQ